MLYQQIRIKFRTECLDRYTVVNSDRMYANELVRWWLNQIIVYGIKLLYSTTSPTSSQSALTTYVFSVLPKQSNAVAGLGIGMFNTLLNMTGNKELPGVMSNLITDSLEGHVNKLPPEEVANFVADGSLGGVR